jgi:hypothetical protein
MVFLVHDISDVPVDLSKLCNFLKWKASTAAGFVSMVLTWILTRLGVLPFTIYWSVLTESWMVCSTGVVDPIYYVCYRHLFFVGLGLLILLHLAWFGMFIQMGYVLLKKGEAHDLSEHKKGEEEHTPPPSPELLLQLQQQQQQQRQQQSKQNGLSQNNGNGHSKKKR